MKKKEKIILYIWLCSLAIILLFGILLCIQRPSSEIIKAQQEVIKLSEKIRERYRNLPDYWGLNGNEVAAKKFVNLKITNNQLYNCLDKPVIIGADITGAQIMPGQRSFIIAYTDLNKKECIALASFRWQEEDKLSLLSMNIYNNGKVYEFDWGKDLPLSRKKAKEYCTENNKIMWTFE